MDQNIKPHLKQITIDGIGESMAVIQTHEFEGCTVSEAARLYAVSPSVIRFHLEAEGRPSYILTKRQVQALKKFGITHKHSSNLRILDMKSMLWLAKTFGTPRSHVVYDTLQKVANFEADQASLCR